MSPLHEFAEQKIAEFTKIRDDLSHPEWERMYADYMLRIARAHADWAQFWAPRTPLESNVRALMHVGAAMCVDALILYEKNVPKDVVEGAIDTWFFDYFRQAVVHGFENAVQMPTIAEVSKVRLDS